MQFEWNVVEKWRLVGNLALVFTPKAKSFYYRQSPKPQGKSDLKMKNCGFCNGEGTITVLAYIDNKSKEVVLKKKANPLIVDCPKCNGTGKRIE